MKNTLFIVSILFLLIQWGCKKPEKEETDTTPLAISIISPKNNTNIQGIVTIKTTVSDTKSNKGSSSVEKVTFYIDEVLLNTVETTPFETVWDTNDFTSGTHLITAKAHDTSGNVTVSNLISVTVINSLFTANFTNNWLCTSCGEAVLFISDENGNLIANQTWTENGSFVFDAPSEISNLSNKITVTTVNRESSSTTNIYITTYFDVPIGSEWTWGKENNYPTTPYTFTLNFNNTPDNDGAILSSKWGSRSYYTPLPETTSNTFLENPDNIYLKLNTITIPKYKWVNNVHNGDVLDINLSNMSDTESKTINFQDEFNHFYISLYGVPSPGNRYDGQYRLDRIAKAYEGLFSTVQIYYPPSFYSEFKTTIKLYDIDTFDYWYQSNYGEISTTFDKINADFSYVSSNIEDFEIASTTDNYDMLGTFWDFSGKGNNAYWKAYSSSSHKSFKLPQFPANINTIFPILDRESFELSSSKLYEYSEINSYEELLNINFNSDDFLFDVVSDVRVRRKESSSKKGLNNSKLNLEEERDYFLNN